MTNIFPVGTIVASNTMAYIKKCRGKDGTPDLYEEYWIGAESWAFPFYSDVQIQKWIKDENYKIVRLGTNG